MSNVHIDLQSASESGSDDEHLVQKKSIRSEQKLLVLSNKAKEILEALDKRKNKKLASNG